MIVIRDRIEYRKHLESQREIIKGQMATSFPRGNGHFHASGILYGLNLAFEALDAWDRCTNHDKEEEQ